MPGSGIRLYKRFVENTTEQCLYLRKKIKCIWDVLNVFKVMKIYYFRGDLTDISATKKELQRARHELHTIADYRVFEIQRFSEPLVFFGGKILVR